MRFPAGSLGRSASEPPSAAYRRLRERSRALFDMLADSTYYRQPIPLRHPVVFYEGHLPGFAFITLVRNARGDRSIDPRLEMLFARGIDPHEQSGSSVDGCAAWPTREEVRRFGDEADRRVLEVLDRLDATGPVAEAVGTVLEHEAMHQETLLYMWHRLPFELKRAPADYVNPDDREARVPLHDWVEVPSGMATLGADRTTAAFGWDNEFPAHRVRVAAFKIERHDVTNARYLEFVEAGGYRDERWWQPDDWRWVRGTDVNHPLFWERDDGAWMWRGQFDRFPLPAAWPVYVSRAEASAFARWSGARLPSEAEYHRAAFGSPEGERMFPWGDEPPGAKHGVFDFSRWDPAPAGSHPDGASAWGIHDLMGNGWEWTATPFGPFPGFTPMSSYPQYSADFFDGEHFVMKGASPVTARELLRRSLRNWFRPRYPYVYATFRCVQDADSRPRHA
jgi:ergothioneine biosynthesis protein EgtB